MSGRTVLKGRPLPDGREEHCLPGFTEPVIAWPGSFQLEQTKIGDGPVVRSQWWLTGVGQDVLVYELHSQ